MLIRMALMRYFNSHPHEEDDCQMNWQELIHWNFNSHPHEEDDEENIEAKKMAVISTHILTKRMTTFMELKGLFESISTHILTKRMTAILNKNNLFKIAYYINNKHFISIVDIFFHFHIYF